MPALDDLARAYRETSFVVEAPHGQVVVRIGARSPRLDALAGHRPWAVVTAWNPFSRPTSDRVNRAAMARLHRRLEAKKAQWLKADGVPDRAGWDPEPSVWLVADRTRAMRLCVVFRQRAVVVATPGGPARLLWHPDAP